MNIPSELKYTKNHEWIRVDPASAGFAFVGITDFAQKELGDIVYIEVETVGETLAKEESFGTVEAVKTVSDLFMPVTGEILEKNAELENKAELVNKDPYGKGWMIRIMIKDKSELDKLLSASEYKELIGEFES